MRRFMALLWLVPCATAQEAPSQPAPDTKPTPQSYEERIAALEKRIHELEAKHEEVEQQDELEKLLRQAEAEGPPPSVRPTAQQSILNPKISVVPDFTGLFRSVSGGDSAKIQHAFGELFTENDPFALRSVDIEFRAPVSPDVDAVGILGVADGEANFEEAYVQLHNLPWDLEAKVGRFKLDFGRANSIHNHDLPQMDRPLVDQLLFGPEGIGVDGISLTRPLYRGEPGGWLPTYSDATVEIYNTTNEESPLFGKTPQQAVGAGGRIKGFWQTSTHSDLEVGASLLAVPDRKDSNAGASQAVGIDATWRYKDPVPGSFADWLVQFELIGSNSDRPNGGTVAATGGYFTVQRRLDEQRYLGVRFDAAQSPIESNADIVGVSPYLTWYMNEFLRLRLQYQYFHGSSGGDTATANGLGLQLTWVFGAHPPEPYWVNK